MTIITARRTATVALAAVSAAAFALPANAAPAGLSGGKTVLALDAGAAGALESLGVAVAPAGKAKAGKAGIAFPITGGKVDTETLAGKIRHSGGLTFSKGKTKLTVSSFTINTRKSVLTAKAGDARIKLLKLDLSDPDVAMKGKRVTVGNVTGSLTKVAAGALNDTFGTDAFEAGLTIGEATVKAKVG